MEMVAATQEGSKVATDHNEITAPLVVTVPEGMGVRVGDAVAEPPGCACFNGRSVPPTRNVNEPGGLAKPGVSRGEVTTRRQNAYASLNYPRTRPAHFAP